MSAVSARSNTCARSPLGTAWPSRSCASLSFSRVSAVAVKRTSYRSAAIGRKVDRAGARVQDEVASLAMGKTASGVAEESVAEESVAGEVPLAGTVAAAAVCTFRTDALTSASGKRAASSFSTSSLPNPEAAESSSWWFSGVSRRASSRAVVGLRVRASNMSTITGNRLAARADSIRL